MPNDLSTTFWGSFHCLNKRSMSSDRRTEVRSIRRVNFIGKAKSVLK